MPDHCAVQDAGDALFSFEAKLEQPLAHRSRMRHTQVGAINFHPFRVAQESGEQSGRERMNFRFEPLAVEGDLPVHARSIANALCAPQAGVFCEVNVRDDARVQAREAALAECRRP